MGRKKKNKLVENVTVEKVGYGGVGIGHLENGKKLIIRGALVPQSVVDVQIKRRRNDFWEGYVSKVRSFDSQWVDAKPHCDHFNNPIHPIPDGKEHTIGCGGCKWQMMSYEKQILLKEKLVIDSFRSAKYILDRIGMEPMVPCPLEYEYRNKMEFSFGKYISGSLQASEDTNEDGEKEIPKKKYINHQRNCGFHKQGQFSKVLDVHTCHLQSSRMHKVFAYIKKMCQDSGLPVYDQKVHTGVFRHLVIREGVNTKQIMINLVYASEQLLTPSLQKQRDTLVQQFSQDAFLREHVTTFLLTTNNGLADIVKGKDIQTSLLFGDGVIYEKLRLQTSEDSVHTSEEEKEYVEASFRISPFAFFQTNTHAAQLLFSQAARLVGKVQGSILDLYCGAGSIGLSFLKMGLGDFCAGIELVSEAIEDAKKNAEINNFSKNTYFVAGKAEDLVFHDPIIKQTAENLGLLIVDPPRSGLHKNVINFLAEMRRNHPCKLLYISCNPVTLARDLDLLEQAGWTTSLIKPVDMFPHTHHIETISILHP